MAPPRHQRGLYAGVGRPPWPFCVNRDSPQAQGLLSWWPLGHTGGQHETDLLNADVLDGINFPSNDVSAEHTYCRNFNGTTQRLATLFPTVPYIRLGTSAPCSIACLFRSTTITANGVLGGVYDTAVVGGSHVALWASGAVGSDPVQAYTVASGGAASAASTSTGYTANTWYHALGVWGGATDRRAFINGGSKGTEATSRISQGLDTVGIGCRYTTSGNTNTFFSGDIADFRIYSRVLTDEEAAAWFSDPRLALDLYYVIGRTKYFLNPNYQTLLPSGISTAEAIGSLSMGDPSIVAQGALVHYRKPVIRRPSWPFCLNKDSAQAQGLFSWWPLGMLGGTGDVIDLGPGSLLLSQTAAPPSVVDPKLRYARSFNGTTTYALNNNNPVSAAPLTMACLFNPVNVTEAKTLMSLNLSSSNNHSWHLDANGGATGDPVDFGCRSGGGSGIARTTTGYTAGSWYHACGVAVSSTDRRAFINGGSKGTHTVDTTPVGVNRVTIGAWGQVSVGFVFNGLLADCRLYNIALSDAQVGEWFSDPRMALDLYYSLGRKKYFWNESNSAPQTVEPSAIDTSEALGTVQLALFLTPTAIATAEAMGTAKLFLYLLPSAITSEEAVGTSTLRFSISPTAIASAEALGTATMLMFIVPSGLVTSEAFGTANVFNLLQFITPSGVSSAEAMGTASLRLYVSPSAVSSVEAFGTAQLNLVISGSGIASGETVGSATLANRQIITCSDIASSESVSQPVVTPIAYILDTGITSGESFGTLKTLLKIIASGVASVETLGTAALANRQTIVVSGIATGEAMGDVVVAPVTYIACSSIASVEAIGAAQLNFRLLFLGVASAESVSSPRLNFRVFPSGVTSAEGFGTAELDFRLHVNGGSIASAEAFGTTEILNTQIISPNGVISREAIGTLNLLPAQFITPGSISSGELFGDHYVSAGVFATFCVEVVAVLLSGAVATEYLPSGTVAVELSCQVAYLVADSLESGVAAAMALESGTVAAEAECGDGC